MPPSHTVSRALIAVLLIALVATVVLVNVDPGVQGTVADRIEALWRALRSTVAGPAASAAADTAAAAR